MNKSIFIKTVLILIMIIHLSNLGHAQNWQWAKSGNGNSADFVSSIAVDDSGNVYVVGGFSSDSLVIDNNTLINDSFPMGDMFIAKLDVNGNLLWTRRAGGTGHDLWTSVALDNSGDVCVAGAFTSQTLMVGATTLNGSGFYNLVVAKYTTGGNVIWAKGAGGSSSSEVANSITTDAFGNIYVTGGFSDTLIFGPFSVTGSIYLVKYDSGGNVIWAKSAMGGEGRLTTTDAFGNIYVTGTYGSDSLIFGTNVLYNDTATSINVYLVKYDANGNALWAANLEGGTAFLDFPESTAITTDAADNVYLGGYFASSSISIGPYVLTNDSTGTADTFIAKYDSSGNVHWAKSMGGSNNDVIGALTADATGDILMSGYFASDAISFDAQTLTNTTSGTSDIFIVKIDTSGATIWAESVGASNYESSNAIASHASGDIYIAGYYVSTALSFGSTTLTNANPLEQDFYIAKMGLPLSMSNIETSAKIVIYPNPTNGKFIISIEDGLEGLEIYDILGKKIVDINQTCYSSSCQINLSAYPAGIYYLRIRTEDVVLRRKLILH